MAVRMLPSGCDRVRAKRRLLLAGTALMGCAVLLSCSANGREAASMVPSSASLPQTAPPEPGSWYLLDNGGLRKSAGPEERSVPFLPWTVQSRFAGFLQVGGRLFLAINGWGVIALKTDGLPAPDVASFEERALFDGRTINGMYADGRKVLVDLYRNTLFDTPSPLPPPISLARINPQANSVAGEALPLTKAGWEASDVVRLPDGRWAVAWKRTTPDRVEFKYEMYAPKNGAEQAISRVAFLDSYGYRAMNAAPRPLQAINAVLAQAARRATVIDYLVRRPALTWVDRYRAGPAKKLFSGDADLLTVPVFREGGAYYALAAGRVIAAGGMAGSSSLSYPGGARGPEPVRVRFIPLPTLPPGYAYTDLWSDGTWLVVSWERQRFTEVGAAGLFIRAVAPTVGTPAASHAQRASER